MADTNNFGDTAPASGIFAITPDDETDLEQVTRGIVASGGGNISVVMRDGSTGVLPLPEGIPMPYRIRRVLDTDTTATGLTGLI
ncbi:MAG: hypothetical protein KDK24_19080 [Pseudooceanicola sp.]|nr:hypothetical protein [Pseudooceanicola sp.]